MSDYNSMLFGYMWALVVMVFIVAHVVFVHYLGIHWVISVAICGWVFYKTAWPGFSRWYMHP